MKIETPLGTVDTDELLADIRRKIAEEEVRFHQHFNNLRERQAEAETQAAWDDWQHEIREAHDKFHAAIEPLRRERDVLLREIAGLVALRPMPPVMIIE